LVLDVREYAGSKEVIGLGHWDFLPLRCPHVRHPAEPDVSSLLTVAQAIAMIDATPVPPPRVEPVALAEADGRVLAGDIVADRDYPPFDRSLMDGYAVRVADVARVPVELNVVGEVAAGATGDAVRVEPGTAVAIMTGRRCRTARTAWCPSRTWRCRRRPARSACSARRPRPAGSSRGGQ
jgi:hypothetical protein